VKGLEVGAAWAAGDEGAAGCAPVGRAWRSSVLKVPVAGSNTSSVEKLGLGAGAAAAACWFLSCSKVRAGLLRVKSSNSASKLAKALAGLVGAGLAGAGLLVGLGRLEGPRVGAGVGERARRACSSLAILKRLLRAPVLVCPGRARLRRAGS
jgi:hypothetical protein